jgi:ADP-heptose:LPS heptosyltransferase
MKSLKAALLRMLTNVKQNPFRRPDIKKILILRYDRIGDMVVSLPVCKALKQGFPNASITMVASEVNYCIADTCKYIDRIIVKPSLSIQWLWMLIRLRHSSYDITLDLNHAVTPHTIFAIRILKPKHVATPFKDGRWGVSGSSLKMFDLMPPEHKLKYDRPISETYLDVARLLQCPTEECLPYPLCRSARLNQLDGEYVLLNYTGSRKSMTLDDKDLEIIVEHIHGMNTTNRIIIPTMAEDYKRLSAKFRQQRFVDVLPPSPTIESLLPIIQYAKLVITPDTALVHIASAYEVPLVAVYTSDKALYQQWRPYPGHNASVIHSAEPKGLNGYSLRELLSSINTALTTHPLQRPLG